jgi:hypothetical protein
MRCGRNRRAAAHAPLEEHGLARLAGIAVKDCRIRGMTITGDWHYGQNAERVQRTPDPLPVNLLAPQSLCSLVGCRYSLI